MFDEFQRLIGHQYEATLCTLSLCIERCPDDRWHAPVVNLAFCQAAFHTLFFTDYYLEPDDAGSGNSRFISSIPNCSGTTRNCCCASRSTATISRTSCSISFTAARRRHELSPPKRRRR